MLGLFAEPKIKNLAVGSPEYFSMQKILIKERPLLIYCYDLWYQSLAKDAESTRAKDAVFLELGSGGGFLKEYIPSLTTSDVIVGVAERVIDGQNLPYENESLNGLFLTHSFHHIPNVELFLSEANRCLKIGGVIGLIEVAKTPLSELMFKFFHPEPFITTCKSWRFQQNNSMMDANQALAWIVFKRDKKLFELRFPQLKVECIQTLPWISYILAGGVTRKCIVPNFLVRPILFLDLILKPLRPIFALHWHIRIRKI